MREAYGEVASDGHIAVDGVCSVCGKKETLLLCGDLNGDGKITAIDAVLLKRLLAHWEIPKPETFVCDANGDDSVAAVDGVLLSRWLAHWEVECLVGQEKHVFL